MSLKAFFVVVIAAAMAAGFALPRPQPAAAHAVSQFQTIDLGE